MSDRLTRLRELAGERDRVEAEILAEILAAKEDGYGWRRIGKALGVSHQTVANIIARHTAAEEAK